MTAMQLLQSNPLPTITWEKLPDDFILPDEPVDNNLQPLLAAALRESLQLHSPPPRRNSYHRPRVYLGNRRG